jgi:hypothetical protein
VCLGVLLVEVPSPKAREPGVLTSTAKDGRPSSRREQEVTFPLPFVLSGLSEGWVRSPLL